MTSAAAPQVIQAPAPAPIHITNVNTNVVNAGGHKRWSPIVAFLLSLLIPGLGQLYKGQLLNGVVWFIVVIVGYALLIVPGVVLHVCCAIGAATGDPYR
jgi:TM2 domain-containing membrane protein YozV